MSFPPVSPDLPLARQARTPLYCGPLRQSFLDQSHHILTILDACRIGGKADVVRPLRSVKYGWGTEDGELRVVAGREHDERIFGGEHLVRDDLGRWKDTSMSANCECNLDHVPPRDETFPTESPLALLSGNWLQC